MGVGSYRWAFVLLGIILILVLLAILAMQVKYRLFLAPRHVSSANHLQSPSNIATVHSSNSLDVTSVHTTDESTQNNNFFADEMKKEFYLPTYYEATNGDRFFARIEPISYSDTMTQYR